MKIAKVAFPNSPYLSSGRKDLLLLFLKEAAIQVELLINPDEADYIFLYPNRLLEMYQLCEKFKNKILILVGIESMAPDFNLFDYALGTNSIDFEDRYCRFQYEIIGVNTFGHNLQVPKEVNLENSTKRKFCSFIYSNPDAHPNRDAFFHKLSEYRKVDSLGKHLRNVDRKISEGFVGDWIGESIKAKSEYKFSIAFENILANNCNTEKIISSMNANTIPLYWGDPCITKYYNSESFINCHSFNSFEEVIERVIELDTNDTMYKEMLVHEWRTPEQIKRVNRNKSDVVNFLSNIFNQNYNLAFRKPVGTFHNRYREFHTTDFKALKRIKKIIHHKAHLIRKRIGL